MDGTLTGAALSAGMAARMGAGIGARMGSLNAWEDPNGFFHAAYLVLNTLCGASTVAIDNKIEQAMDLVKSHLMFAVREEVEVLKEQIKELLEKNSQLEVENSILRSAASQETLAKVQASAGATAAAAAVAKAAAAPPPQPATTSS